MKKTLVLLLAVVLCSLGMQSLLWGQSSFTVPIYVTNGTEKETLWVGVDPTGTFATDASLGEIEAPPAPPAGAFDARLTDPRTSGTSTSFGVGRVKDIRHYTSDCQTDTFEVTFQPQTEAGNNVTFSWPSSVDTLGCGRWRLTNSLGSAPALDVDMMTDADRSVTVSYLDYSRIYIRKTDGTQFRTFTMATLATDGLTDAKGKKSYGKSVKAVSNQVEFCVTVKNTSGVSVNKLHIEFKTPVDSATIEVNSFTTIATDAKQKAGAKTKFDFTGATIDTGATITICGFGVKSGTKAQAVGGFWWLNGTTIAGAKQKGTAATFGTNILRLPMPNTVNAGEQMMTQALPLKTDLLIVGTTARTDTLKYVQHKKYADVLKTWIKDAGKIGKEKMQNANASYLNNFDDAKKGLRAGKGIKGAQKSLDPSKHQNRLLGEALTLAVNIKFSETVKIPAGLGSLTLNLPSSPFNGLSVDSVLRAANHFLSYGSLSGMPTVDADDLADICADLNGAFDGDLDTTENGWGGNAGKVKFSGVLPIGDVPWLLRPEGVEPTIIPELSGTYANAPEQYELAQNYPNPFNPTTTISFNLVNDGLVTVKIFNILGQEVATLLNQAEYGVGMNEITFDASNMSSGVYFYRIQVNDMTSGEVAFQDLKKMVLLK